jgi:NADPH2:quinone reductase
MIIPETMKAVHLEKAGGPLVVRTVQVPEPKKGEVLVRMSASPVNPSDLHRINSVEEDNLSSFVPGIEGSGTVVLFIMKAAPGQNIW